jgi:FMNH2-dependent dimethyl sulfone monooxygenase
LASSSPSKVLNILFTIGSATPKAPAARSGKPALVAAMRVQKKRIAGGFGSFGIAGSPRDIADQIIELKRAGLHGVSLSFVNFRDELPYFLETVMSLLEGAGLR